MTEISTMADLRPGDIMFGPIGGLVGLGVGLGQVAIGEGFRVGPLSIRHVGIVAQASGFKAGHWMAPRLVQVMPGGAEEVEMAVDKHWTGRHAYVRLTEDWPGQAQDAARIAQLMVERGVAYSFASYAALALWHWGLQAERLERWINRRQPGMVTLDEWSNGPSMPTSDPVRGGQLPVEAICSVLVDQAWSLAGKKIMVGRPRQCVTPGDLARRLLFGTPGVQWALPGRAS